MSTAEEVDAPQRVDNRISGDVREWAINLTAAKAEAGEVTFTITNYGTIQHEFLVVRTDHPIGGIPVRSENRFDEEEPGIIVVDEIPEFDVGTTGTVALDLEPGAYQVVCNIAGHYQKGMFAAFEVEA